MRPKGSADLLQYRRRQALELFDEGRSLNEVARIIGCDPSSVMRWRDARAEGGEEALEVRFSPGRPPKLTEGQKHKLEKNSSKVLWPLGTGLISGPPRA